MTTCPKPLLAAFKAATALLAVTSCTTEPELETLTFEGRVLSEGTPVSPGYAIVILIDPLARTGASTSTEADGVYRLEVPLVEDLCRSSLVGFHASAPFPVESDRNDGEIELGSGMRCEGVVPGPDIELPVQVAELDSVRVLGVVTRDGQPAVADVTLFIDSPAWGPEVIATTTSDGDGNYEIEGAVPWYYCDDLQIRSDPPANAFLSPGGCSASLVNIPLGG